MVATFVLERNFLIEKENVLIPGTQEGIEYKHGEAGIDPDLGHLQVCEKGELQERIRHRSNPGQQC